jgi:RNA polymerase sigma-70 factor (ECF subfamily)
LEEQVTALLGRVRAGDAAASDELMAVVYAELHGIARMRIGKERPDHTLQATALVNEAYLKMFAHTNPQFADRAHFMAFASRSMRRILVDYARARGSAKRGGEAPKIALDENLDAAGNDADYRIDLLDLGLAIEGLVREQPLLGPVIDMHYFGGMTAAEIAEAVGRSVHVVRRELRFAQALLRRELSAGKTAS